MAKADSLSLDEIDPVLGQVVQDYQVKVVGWLKNEPGCWGFLAGQAVAATRRQTGRSLSDTERRLVWDRLWWVLESIKREVSR